MSDIINDRIALGAVLKTLRLSKDLTVEQVARQSGVTKGSISLIENGKRGPSPTMLKNLLAVYGESLATFFSKVEEKRRKFVYKAKDSTVIAGKRGGVACAELLIPIKKGSDIELIKVTLKQGGKLDEWISHTVQVYGYVIKGQIAITLNKKKYIVQAGDSFCYPADQPHSVRNSGKGVVEIIYAIAPPNFKTQD